MSENTEQARAVVSLMAQQWLSRDEQQIRDHVNDMYPRAALELGGRVSNDLVHAVEIEDGDVSQERMGGIPLRWWGATVRGCELIPPLDKSSYNEADDRDEFWPVVYLACFIDFPFVLLREQLSIRTMSRFSIRLSQSGETLSVVERKLTWKADNGIVADLSGQV